MARILPLIFLFGFIAAANGQQGPEEDVRVRLYT